MVVVDGDGYCGPVITIQFICAYQEFNVFNFQFTKYINIVICVAVCLLYRTYFKAQNNTGLICIGPRIKENAHKPLPNWPFTPLIPIGALLFTPLYLIVVVVVVVLTCAPCAPLENYDVAINTAKFAHTVVSLWSDSGETRCTIQDCRYEVVCSQSADQLLLADHILSLELQSTRPRPRPRSSSELRKL